MHILVHKDNTIVQSNNWVLPLGIGLPAKIASRYTTRPTGGA